MKPLFLVGYMGCGKSTVGRKLARRLGWRFADTDALVEEAEGASVADIFHYEGEELIASGGPVVVSTGGGLPAWGDNMERMNAAGMTVYLQRSAECIARRLSPYGRRKRPKLRGLSDEELVPFMERDMAQRSPFYERARLVLACDALSDEAALDAIAARLGAGGDV